MPEPIDSQYVAMMSGLAKDLDAILNGGLSGNDRKIAFVLLITEFGNIEGRVNYISNSIREDVVTMLKEIISRFEGQPEMKGTA
jgi:hypothetical protein